MNDYSCLLTNNIIVAYKHKTFILFQCMHINICHYVCSNERKKYHRHREKSRSEPDKYGTIIIDGMDQAKTNLPHLIRESKSSSGLWNLRTHVTGSLFHTKSPHGKLAFSFIDLIQWPHDSNLTITILVKVLLERIKVAPLPETLYIQLDNTCRENKNKYVLAFCAYLVDKKIFKKVCTTIYTSVFIQYMYIYI